MRRVARRLVGEIGPPEEFREVPLEVPWFDWTLHPSKRFLYWAFRHLRHVPSDVRQYYRGLLRQEVKAVQFANRNWDIFICVAEGYRKTKWVLKKYNCPVDESAIPHPYNNFWENTTTEERAWAHRRSYALKELQALQREDDDEMVYGAIEYDRAAITSQMQATTGGTRHQRGNPLHSMDLPAPKESEIRDNEQYSDALMCTVYDDYTWNPVLTSKKYRENIEAQDELLQFEDAEDDGEDVEKS